MNTLSHLIAFAPARADAAPTSFRINSVTGHLYPSDQPGMACFIPVGFFIGPKRLFHAGAYAASGWAAANMAAGHIAVGLGLQSFPALHEGPIPRRSDHATFLQNLQVIAQRRSLKAPSGLSAKGLRVTKANRPATKVRARIAKALGIFSMNCSTTISFLEDEGQQFNKKEEDMVLFTAFVRTDDKGVITSRGEVVIPGTKTLAAHSKTSRYGVHFRKTYTAKAPQIIAGETPSTEAGQTSFAINNKANAADCLGYDELTYRSRVIPGKPLTALSFFADLSYDHGLDRQGSISVQQAAEMNVILQKCFDAAAALHTAKLVHNDLHTGHVLCDFSGSSPRAALIDFTSCTRSKEGKEGKSATPLDLLIHDANQILRESAMLQACCGVTTSQVARLAWQNLDTLFPGPIAERIRFVSEHLPETPVEVAPSPEAAIAA